MTLIGFVNALWAPGLAERASKQRLAATGRDDELVALRPMSWQTFGAAEGTRVGYEDRVFICTPDARAACWPKPGTSRWRGSSHAGNTIKF